MAWFELWFYVLQFVGLIGGAGVVSTLASRPPFRVTSGPRCQKCDYDLAATPPGAPCPECGDWQRTFVFGSEARVRWEASIKVLCAVLPLLAAAVLGTWMVNGPASDRLWGAGLGALSAAPIAVGVAALRSRAWAWETVAITLPATMGVLAMLALIVRPEGRAGLCCASFYTLGPAGLGAGLGGLAVWMRWELTARRT